jgi:hypothetical protein
MQFLRLSMKPADRKTREAHREGGLRSHPRGRSRQEEEPFSSRSNSDTIRRPLIVLVQLGSIICYCSMATKMFFPFRMKFCSQSYAPESQGVRSRSGDGGFFKKAYFGFIVPNHYKFVLQQRLFLITKFFFQFFLLVFIAFFHVDIVVFFSFSALFRSPNTHGTVPLSVSRPQGTSRRGIPRGLLGPKKTCFPAKKHVFRQKNDVFG